MCSRKARTLAARSFARLTRRRISSRKSPPAEKTDFLALAMMQTEVSVQASERSDKPFQFREHGGANFVSRSMIECQFNDAFAPFPTQVFAVKFSFSGVLLAGRLAGAFRIVLALIPKHIAH